MLFTYVLLHAARFDWGNLQLISGFPHNVLIAMGFSVVTLAGAKGIAVSYKNSGRVDKPAVGSGGNKVVGGLITDDDGQVDLSKVQMLMWTLIASIVCLYQVIAQLDTFATCVVKQAGGSCECPDIDGALMVLMGLGQGAYLGNKLGNGIEFLTPQAATRN